MPIILKISTGIEASGELEFTRVGLFLKADTINAPSIIYNGFIRKENVVEKKRSKARGLLKFAGAWVGDDLDERLKEVYATRSKTKF